MLLDDVEREYGMLDLYDKHLEQQFYEFDLADFGLPSAEELLVATKAIEAELGLQGFRANGRTNESYKGFSLTYNPNLGVDPFATMGDFRLGQNGITQLDNSFYDTYRFSAVHPVVAKHYKPLLDRLNCQLTRSRTAYIYPNGKSAFEINYHRDEYPHQNLRINIPLQTTREYVLEINGNDENNNSLSLIKNLSVGKFYIWNTRLPHRVYAQEKPKSEDPRIHIVLGIMPWINVDGETFTKHHFFGIQPFELVKRGLLFK